MSALLSPAQPTEALPAVASLLATAREAHRQGRLRTAAEAYRQTLNLAPHSQTALLALSLIARQSNQPLPALRMAQAALAAGPHSALAWAIYGDTLTALDSFAPAESAFRRALDLAPQDPAVATAHYGLGNCLARKNDFASTLASFERAVQLAPTFPEFHFAQAFALGKLGRHAEAVCAYRQAVTLRPSFASAWLNLGVELAADGRAGLAAPCYGQAIATAASKGSSGLTTQISAHLNLGHLARGHRRFAQAQLQYERALMLAAPTPHRKSGPSPSATPSESRLAEVHIAFACLHLDQKQYPQAWQSLRDAEAASAQTAPALRNPEIANTRGILLLAEHSAISNPEPYAELVEAAIEAFREAEAAGHVTAASNRGNALLRLGRCAEALEAHQAAVDRDPYHPGARDNLALTQLRLGDFANGWRNYEIRWSFREVHPQPRRFPQTRWSGEPLAPSSTLLLYAEQGLGDTLQFIRYLPFVAQRLPGSTLLVEVQTALTRLLNPYLIRIAKYHATQAHLVAQGDALPHFTHHCPLMSLPAVFATTLETIPSKIPYLQANWESACERISEMVNAISQPPVPKIGLNWAGNPNYRADHERSTRLDTFRPLLEIPGIRWISLQKGSPARQIEDLPAHLRLDDACSAGRDLADTAALIASLDLVLTTDTAIAHLAGALGKPLWLLLPWQSDWRWMQDRCDTPWYPQARLFRQSSPGNWPGLIERIVRELQAALAHPARATGLPFLPSQSLLTR